MNVLDSLKQRTYQVARFVKFQYCYVLYFASIALGISFSIAVYVFKIDILNNLVLQIVGNGIGGFIALIVSLYLSLGYIKYSRIIGNDRLHAIISINMLMGIAGFILLNMPYTFDGLYDKYKVVPMATTFLLFYVFRTIKNEEMPYFKKLSGAFLILFYLHVMMTGLKLIVGLWSVYKVLFFAFSVISLLATYWQAKLFQHLYYKYEKVQQ